MKQQPLAEAVAVIALVSKERLWRWDRHDHQIIYGLIIRCFSADEDKAEKPSLIVTAGVDFARKATASSTKSFLNGPPFALAACAWPRTMVLSILCCQVVGQTDIDQRLQKGIPDALLGPATKPDINRVPLTVAFVHIPPRTARPQGMEHAVEK